MNSDQVIQRVNALWEELQLKFREINIDRNYSIENVQLALMETDEAIRRLKSIVVDHTFDTWQEEIQFFKCIKPKFIAEFILYSKIVSFLSSLPLGGDTLVTKKIDAEFELLRIFSEEHIDFLNYYRRNSTFLDKKYFVRFQYDLQVKLALDVHSFDDRFSTSHDYIVAHVLANDKYEYFLKNQRIALDSEVAIGLTYKKRITEWTASKAALVELIFALHFSKSINRGSVDLAEIVRIFEDTFSIDLGNYHKTFSEIKNRKSNPTRFLTHLQNLVLRDIDEEERWEDA